MLSIMTTYHSDFSATLKWDKRGLGLAREVSTWSSCPRDKVGAVVMTPEHDVVATGFNDTPRGMVNCDAGGCPRVQRGSPSGSPYLDDEWCLHAEDNALQRAGLRARGAALYVTRSPCANCRRRAYTAGITRIVYGAPEIHTVAEGFTAVVSPPS